MSEQINSVDFWVDELTRDINPDHFGFYKRVIPYRDDEKISKYGSWMWNNGYNVGLYNLQTKVNTYCIPQWISVKYRLPEPLENVLTYDGDGRILINWRPDEDDKAEEVVYFARGNSVTHWMPLPKPPESEGDTNA